jgi:hypothetical protein
MKFRYTGRAHVRIIGKYEWNAENGYVQDVTDEELILNLQTYPRNEWEEVPEPVKTKTKKVGGK